MKPTPNDQGFRGPESMSEVLARLEAEGFTGQFQTQPDSMVLCLTCRSLSAAATLPVGVGSSRLEGASDPSDMSLIVPLKCPVCGTRGTLVLRYGPEASADESDVLNALELDGSDGAIGR